MSIRFDNKVAIVTGAGGGIGKEHALELAKRGAKVVVNDLGGTVDGSGASDAANEVVELIKSNGGDAFANGASVTDLNAVKAMVDQTMDQWGRIDILVNNAGIIKRVPILDMPVEEYRQVIDVDLIAPFMVGKRVAPGMIEKGAGKIINMCSMMSEYGRKSVSAYASAKGGLKLLTANMCCEWAKHNIQVNGIGPGYIATSQTAPIREGGHPFNDLVMTRTPANRWGEPEDVGHAALFLASKASQFVNGHVLYVDGGILANFGYVKGENDL